MPPVDFEALAKAAFDEIKCGLGTEAEYLPKSGGQFSVRGVFDDRIQEVDPDTEIAVSSNIYSFGVKIDDLPAPPQKGDKVLISGVAYRVIDSQEDGAQGVSTFLIMHKVEGQ